MVCLAGVEGDTWGSTRVGQERGERKKEGKEATAFIVVSRQSW